MDSVTVNGYGQFRNHFNASDAFASVKQNYVVSHSARKIKFRAIHAGFEIAVRMFRTDGKSLTVINSGENFLRDFMRRNSKKMYKFNQFSLEPLFYYI
jgi:thiamine biosynthesis protein ThiC